MKTYENDDDVHGLCWKFLRAAENAHYTVLKWMTECEYFVSLISYHIEMERDVFSLDC